MIIRFCQDCNQERTDTSWSDHFGTRLCVDCYNHRCEPIDMAPAKQKLAAEQYKRRVLNAYDDMEHADKRAVLDTKAEVQIKARERL